MDKSEESGPNKPSIRYAAVSLVLSKIHAGTSTSYAVAKTIEAMEKTQIKISRSALYRWLKKYKDKGWSSLQQPNCPRQATALPEKFIIFLSKEKNSDPKASIPEVIRRAREKGIIGSERSLDRITVYRQARKMNLPLMRQRRGESNTKRPFAYPHRMQMVLCDGKHFRAGPQRLKRVVLTFIDDSSRYILGSIVGPSESSSLFLRGLFDVIANHGLMDNLYVDKGTGFNNDAAKMVAQQLDIPLIFGATRYPQGHGKVERYNRTLKEQCLRGLAKPGIDPNFSALRIRIHHFTREVYGKARHETIGISPEKKFLEDPKTLKRPKDRQELERCFTLMDTRKVREDNVITYNNILYELPLGYAGTLVTIFINTVSDNLSMIHNGASTRLLPPDLTFNARERRMKTAKHHEESEPTIITAAEIRFNKDIKPIVDNRGGYSIQHEDIKDD